MGKKTKVMHVDSKEPVRKHLVLLKYLIDEGPKTVRQIKDHFNWSDRTVRDRLAKLTLGDGLVRKLKGGKSARYAYYTYTDQRFMIKKLLLERFPRDIEYGLIHPNLYIAASRMLGLVDDEQFRKDLTDVFKELHATYKK